MAIKVQFEIGHSSTVKSKRTPEGFTHDWELYVQGVNKADISSFVDRVVFNLHDSFPKPKRSFKEPPYVLKESGYAGFVLAIDIYFRNRDEPKRVTFSYDLDLQHEGPPLHRSEVKKFIFDAPSEDFRQKLLKGGGVAVSGVVGGAITSDERSLDMSIPDSRSQMVGKPKLSTDASGTSTSSSSSKKHKQRPDDSKTNTFTNLFGTPINKTAPKFSPDPKTKTANGGTGAPIAAAVANSKSGGGKDKTNSGGNATSAATTTSGPLAGGGKEKDKSEKKDKHKQLSSPHKEKAHDDKESKKKSDGKHEKREEKKKDKKDKDKDRERNKDKASKRSLSPKTAAAPSPKRPSPLRSSSAASRDDSSATVKSSSKSSESDKRASGSSSSKKSKKEKKSHDKDREHKDKHRAEPKESIPAVAAAPTVPAVIPVAAAAPATTQPPSQSSSKVPNPTVASKSDLSSRNQKASEKESKKSDSTTKTTDKDGTTLASDKKSSTDKDKKSHKHRKKDKNKEKEKEKDKDQPSKKSTVSKEKKDKKDKAAKNEVPSGTTAASSKKVAAATEMPAEAHTASTSTKSAPSVSSSKASKQSSNASTVPSTNSNSNNNTITMGSSASASGLSSAVNDLSDVDSLNSESLHATSNSNSEKNIPIQNSDSSNSSIPDLPAAKNLTLFQAPANPQPTPPPSTTSTPSSTPSSLSSAGIQEPPRPVPLSDKKDHKTHRGADKSKAEKQDKKRRRNSTAVNTFVEPPLKQIKKDFNAKTAREKSQSPLLRAEDKQTFLPPPATTSTLPAQNTPVTALNLEYLSELQELHQKIMTLQDNEELQQVVEMIAATGRYEITSKTFDFDLCKLDRNTVQRLQDFFSTSVS